MLTSWGGVDYTDYPESCSDTNGCLIVLVTNYFHNPNYKPYSANLYWTAMWAFWWMHWLS